MIPSRGSARLFGLPRYVGAQLSGITSRYLDTRSGTKPVAVHRVLPVPARWKLICTDAVLAWIALHVVCLSTSIVVSRLVTHADWQTPWLNYFDSVAFAKIAVWGYTNRLLPAYYPLFPLTERVVMPLTGGNPYTAGTVVSNICSLGAFMLIRGWGERVYGRVESRRLLAYVATTPMALYLLTSYSEALFLLLSAGVFVATSCKRWLTAGALVALATLCRPVGILLLAPLVIGMWHSRDKVRRRDAAALTFGPAVLLGFLLYLWRTTGVWNAPNVAEWDYFRRGPAWPWTGIVQAMWAIWHAPTPQLAIGVAFDLLSAICGIALAIALALRWRHEYLPAVVYAVMSVVVLLALPYHFGFVWRYPPTGLSNTNALTVLPRYLFVVFPLALPLVHLGTRWKWAHYAVLTCNLAVLVWATAQFSQFLLIE